MRSRVIPGSSVTIARRVPVKRLNNVDLPTLGRPTITSDGKFCAMNIFVPRKKTRAVRENLSRALRWRTDRAIPQQDVQQLYRIAASVQSRARTVAHAHNGLQASHETGSLDYLTNDATGGYKFIHDFQYYI